MEGAAELERSRPVISRSKRSWGTHQDLRLLSILELHLLGVFGGLSFLVLGYVRMKHRDFHPGSEVQRLRGVLQKQTYTFIQMQNSNCASSRACIGLLTSTDVRTGYQYFVSSSVIGLGSSQ